VPSPRRPRLWQVACFGAALTGSGCSSRGAEPSADASPGFDAGGASEAGALDTGVTDARPLDAPSTDAGVRDGGGYDATCATVRLETRRTTPNVMILIDQSGSMRLGFEPGVSRWTAVRDALLAPPDGLVVTLAPVVRFGVAMYTDDVEVAGCPDLATVPASLDNVAAIQLEYDWNAPSGNTPTGDTVASVLASIDTLVPSRADPTFLVLATDGEPGTCEDGTDVVAGRQRSVDAVTAAYAAGIPTYVISVGTDVAASHLQDVANAGAGHVTGGPDAPFYVATDVSELRDALWTVVGSTVSCTVELVGRIDPGAACRGTLALDGEVLTCDVDWHAVDATHVELLGTACDRLRRSAGALTGSFPCDVVLF